MMYIMIVFCLQCGDRKMMVNMVIDNSRVVIMINIEKECLKGFNMLLFCMVELKV